jgi:hypothetical protein
VPIARRQLDEGEEVLVDLRPHWVFLFGPLATTALALVAVLSLATAFTHLPVAVGVLLAVVVAVPAAWLAARAVQWWTTSLVVTDRRFVSRQGVFTPQVAEVRLDRVAEVYARQEIWQRLLGTGRLVVSLRQEAGAIVVDDVRRPKSLQRVIFRQLEHTDVDDEPEVERPASAPVGGADDPTPPRGLLRRPVDASWISAQLIELDDLRRRGILSDGEFAAKKAELLSRL